MTHSTMMHGSSNDSVSRNSTNVREGSSYRPRAGRALGWLSRISPLLGGWVGLNWFTRPRQYPRPPREREWLERGERFELLPGVVGHHFGVGPVVLLVHGWEGRGSQLGAFIEPLVQAGFRVVLFDALAHGDSGGTHATLMSFVHGIEAVRRRFDALHGVVAHSFGCAAVNLALVRGLSLHAAVYLAPPANLDQAPAYFARLTGMTKAAEQAMKNRLVRRVGFSFDDLCVPSFAARMHTPLFIVHDEQDQDVHVANATVYERHWPNSVLQLTSGLGHRRLLRDPAVIRDCVAAVDQGLRPRYDKNFQSWLDELDLADTEQQ